MITVWTASKEQQMATVKAVNSIQANEWKIPIVFNIASLINLINPCYKKLLHNKVKQFILPDYATMIAFVK